MSLDWSDWLTTRKRVEYYNAAVYKVRWAREGSPVPIQRFAATDPHGILCIGKTKNMDQRRRNFGNGLRRGEGHSEADILYYLRHYGQSLILPEEDELQYSHAPVETEDVALLNEEMLILSYMREFGEVPPLNSAIPGKKDPVAWQAAKALRDVGAI